MPTKLDKLLEEIDPSRTIDVMDSRVNKAMNSFCYPHASITDWEEFRECLTDFLGHIENNALMSMFPVILKWIGIIVAGFLVNSMTAMETKQHLRWPGLEMKADCMLY